MNNILTISKKELKSYFLSPVAYIVIIGFLLAAGFLFTKDLFLMGVVSIRFLFESIWFLLLFVFIIPAITMGTFSEEKRSGTMELLLTKPITDTQLMLGKFLASLIFAVIIIIPTIVYIISLKYLGAIDLGPVISMYLGFILLFAFLVSIGIFTSSLTQYQVISFIISFLIMAVFFMLYIFTNYIPLLSVPIIDYFNPFIHMNNMFRGVIDSRDLIYFISGTIIFLILTKLSIESRKW
ncbi:MAG TPA: ABC transporter permease [Ignavibacteria bacterium]|nr:ABC transporter permease [Ignavibacteria bacterium]